MLIFAIALLNLILPSEYAEPGTLSDRAVRGRYDATTAWLDWYEQEPSIIREKRELRDLARDKRRYSERLADEIGRRRRSKSDSAT